MIAVETGKTPNLVTHLAWLGLNKIPPNSSRFTRLYWIICWKWLTPTILLVLLLMSWSTFGHVTYDNGYVYPLNIQILGYFITGCTVIWIPVGAETFRAFRASAKL